MKNKSSSKGYKSSNNRESSSNEKETRYSCPACGGPMPNDMGYVEYQGYIQSIPYQPGMIATCLDCAKGYKSNYHKGLRSQ